MAKIYFGWNANETGVTVDFYRIYAGTTSGLYDHPDSPKNMGNTTSGFFDISIFGSPLYFALTAVNNTGGESAFSAEVVRTLAEPISMLG